MTTLTEVSGRGRQIARTTNLPSIIDIDTGFGEPMSCIRTVLELEELGISGCHLEDQVNPKRCGHLDNKSLVETKAVCQKSKRQQMESAIRTFLSLPERMLVLPKD